MSEPSETIVFGEKKPESNHCSVDFLEDDGNALNELLWNMHGSKASTQAVADPFTPMSMAM